MKTTYFLDKKHPVAVIYETREFELTTEKLLRASDDRIYFEVNPVGNPNSTAYVLLNDLTTSL